MNAEEFVSALNLVVCDAAIKDVVSILRAPAGGVRDSRYTNIQKWFSGLSEQDQQNLVSVLEETTDACLFGFCAVLDKIRAFDRARPPGKLELYYVRGEERVLINDPKNDQLNYFAKGLASH
jgi:hypothetical protein